jgi:hypothetical protein
VGWSDLGWAMKNLSAVSMGRQFFWYVHQTKTHVNYILHKDINSKSKQNYPNYQMQMMLLKPVLCFIQQQEVVESQQIQPAGEQLSIVIGDDECRCIFTMFIPASFFYYKIVFSQFRI